MLQHARSSSSLGELEASVVWQRRMVSPSSTPLAVLRPSTGPTASVIRRGADQLGIRSQAGIVIGSRTRTCSRASDIGLTRSLYSRAVGARCGGEAIKQKTTCWRAKQKPRGHARGVQFSLLRNDPFGRGDVVASARRYSASQKNHLGLRPPVGVETVEVYPLGGRERPTAFWWQVTPQKNMVHGLLRT